MSTFQDMGSLLLVRGADELEHAGGTLYVHLHRVAKRLTSLGASDTLALAGLAHAAYGTDGFPTHLFDWQTERPVLESVIVNELDVLEHAPALAPKLRPFLQEQIPRWQSLASPAVFTESQRALQS
jgi:hypothetical protein